jgi:tetratricopeptide (TPR) repeat protein
MPEATGIFGGCRWSIVWWTMLAGVWFAAADPVTTNISVNTTPLEWSRRDHATWLERHRQKPGDLEAAWQFARACFDRAEFATNNSERAAIANQGIRAARAALSQNATNVPALYYLGMNLGQLARTRSLGALRLVDQMVELFAQARTLDPMFDFAGPDRNLGLLHREAPAIASVGNREKARVHLERAARLAPDYPENTLNLAESYFKWGNRKAASTQLQRLEQIWEEARKTLVSENWQAAWKDWTRRADDLRRRLARS